MNLYLCFSPLSTSAFILSAGTRRGRLYLLKWFVSLGSNNGFGLRAVQTRPSAWREIEERRGRDDCSQRILMHSWVRERDNHTSLNKDLWASFLKHVDAGSFWCLEGGVKILGYDFTFINYNNTFFKKREISGFLRDPSHGPSEIILECWFAA